MRVRQQGGEWLEPGEQGEKHEMRSERVGERGRTQGLRGHCREFGFLLKESSGQWRVLRRKMAQSD